MLNSDVQATHGRAQTPLRVERDFGQIDLQSSTSPHRVRTTEGAEFVIKCPAFTRDPHPYICANEWIAGLLGAQCGLRTLPMVVVQHADGLAVGWPFVPYSDRVDVPTAPRILRALANADDLYGLAAFDALIRNTDRNRKNVMVLRHPSGVLVLVAYDHDRALMYPDQRITPVNLNEWPELDDPRVWIRVGEIVDELSDVAKLQQAVAQVSDSCSDQDIEDIVMSTPPHWLQTAERGAVVQFIQDRRARLWELVEGKARVILPRLFSQ